MTLNQTDGSSAEAGLVIKTLDFGGLTLLSHNRSSSQFWEGDWRMWSSYGVSSCSIYATVLERALLSGPWNSGPAQKGSWEFAHPVNMCCVVLNMKRDHLKVFGFKMGFVSNDDI